MTYTIFSVCVGLLWFLQIISNLLDIFRKDPEKCLKTNPEDLSNKRLIYISYIFMFAIGLALTGLRFMDDFVRQEVMEEFKKFFGKYETKEQK